MISINTAATASDSTDWKSDQDRFDAAAKVQPTCWDEPDKFGYWKTHDLRPKPRPTRRLTQSRSSSSAAPVGDLGARPW